MEHKQYNTTNYAVRIAKQANQRLKGRRNVFLFLQMLCLKLSSILVQSFAA